jgi:hypothetical protein
MVVYHCSKCHHEWESPKITVHNICGWCGEEGFPLEEGPNANDEIIECIINKLTESGDCYSLKIRDKIIKHCCSPIDKKE